MRKIEKYKLAWYSFDGNDVPKQLMGEIPNIEGEVNELIKEGWQPIGGVFIVPSDSNTGLHFQYQAMVKYEFN